MKKIFSFFAFFLVVSGFVLEGFAFTDPPSQVTGLRVSPGDTSFIAEWQPVRQNVLGYTVYYGTTSVRNGSSFYDNQFQVEGSLTSAEVKNLLNNIPYYVSVKAINDQGIESDAYSEEVMVTPVSGALEQSVGEDQFPKVLKASHISPTEVRVRFSEPVVFDDPNRAFVIEEGDSFREIYIQDFRNEDLDVILVIQKGALLPQKMYEVVATSVVQDLEGNPVSSGITDHASFQARSDFDVLENEDMVRESSLEPEVESFLETSVEVEESVGSALEENEDFLLSASQNSMSGDSLGVAVDLSHLDDEQIVKLDWVLDSFGQGIQDQVLYTRKKGDVWDSGYSLGPSLDALEMEVDMNSHYEVRIDVIDGSGNEVEGEIMTFSTYILPSTGISTWAVFFVVLFGILIAFSYFRSWKDAV